MSESVSYLHAPLFELLDGRLLDFLLALLGVYLRWVKHDGNGP